MTPPEVIYQIKHPGTLQETVKAFYLLARAPDGRIFARQVDTQEDVMLRADEVMFSRENIPNPDERTRP